MGRPYKVTAHYQIWEEVLSSSWIYFTDVPGTNVNTLFMDNLANAYEGAFGDIENILSEPWKLWAVEVTTPNLGDNEGPARFIRTSANDVGAAGFAPMPDAVCYNILFSAVKQNGEPITGGPRLSGVPKNQVDCNVLDGGFLPGAIQDLEAFFPLTRNVSGTDCNLVIESTDEQGSPVWLPVNNVTLSPQVGFRIDRVLDRPWRKGSPQPA